MGCAATPPPTQKAQQSKVSPTRAGYGSVCRSSGGALQHWRTENCCYRLPNSFRGAQQMRGIPSVKEGFVCSFDADGQFIFLCGKALVVYGTEIGNFR
ncbi:hypothetical protein KCP75_19395 [Salmonella enterica subsp. enterica]|nr:hypothetical protein KCP75_19395 [Salmonella enterica subsp. enterica]